MAESTRYRIGVALPPDLYGRIITPALLECATDRALDFIRISPDMPLIDQGPFHCVLHNLAGDDWSREVDILQSSDPDTLIIDHPESIARLRDPVAMMQAVSQVEIIGEGECSVGVPRQTILYELIDPVSWEHIRFPVIAKSLDGRSEELMVYDSIALKKLNAPLVVEEFVGGFAWKIHVLGESWVQLERLKLPTDADADVVNKFGKEEVLSLSDIELPESENPRALAMSVAKDLREGLNLSFFSFDLVKHSEKHYIISNVKTFPELWKLRRFERKFVEFLAGRAEFVGLTRLERAEADAAATRKAMAEVASRRPLRVGYALGSEKLNSLMRASFLERAEREGIKFIEIHTSRRLIKQGSFHCILHKRYGENWKGQLREYQASNPDTLIIDPPQITEPLRSPIGMLQPFANLPINLADSECVFRVPQQIVLHDKDPNSWVYGLTFPMIVRTLDGISNPNIVYTDTALKKLTPPLVLQGFPRDGFTVFSVLNVGEVVKCVSTEIPPRRPYLMKSDQVWNFSNLSRFAKIEKDNQPIILANAIAKELRNSLKLKIFGFDMRRDTQVEKKFVVINLNYFPELANMAEYEDLLVNLFRDM